jgi:hypothetical protein
MVLEQYNVIDVALPGFEPLLPKPSVFAPQRSTPNPQP